MPAQSLGPRHWKQMLLLQAWKTQPGHHPKLWPHVREARMLTCQEQMKAAHLSPCQTTEFSRWGTQHTDAADLEGSIGDTYTRHQDQTSDIRTPISPVLHSHVRLHMHLQ